MIVIKLDKTNWKKVVAFTAVFLAEGRTVVYPTETFYGLGGDMADRAVARKIYRIKGRAVTKALPLVVSDLAMADKFLKVTPLARKLARQYWPGPLSLVLPLKIRGRRLLGRQDAGVRASSHDFASALAKKLGRPIYSTSANPTGQASPQSARQVVRYFKERQFKPDLVIDAGRLPKSRGSTFVDLTGKEPRMLREGDIKIKIQGHKIQ